MLSQLKKPLLIILSIPQAFESEITIYFLFVRKSSKVNPNFSCQILRLLPSTILGVLTLTSYTPINSPLIPFLTSFLFRLGFVDKTSIFVVTGVFYIIGVLYSYFLFKLRFDNKYALFGSIIFACCYSNVRWVAVGTIDIPAIALSIMTIYYLILGVNKNQKYIYLSFILLALAFLAKYSAILILPLMILYPLFKGDFKVIKKYFKTYVIGGLLAVAVNIPFLLYLISILYISDISEIGKYIVLSFCTSGKLSTISIQ